MKELCTGSSGKTCAQWTEKKYLRKNFNGNVRIGDTTRDSCEKGGWTMSESRS